MASKIYTAQEMRYAANLRDAWGDKDEVNAMLYYAADMVERCEKVIARCNAAKDMNSPNYSFDKQAFAMDLQEIINYILRGDAGKET